MIGSTSINIAHFGQACLSLLQKIAKPDFEQEVTARQATTTEGDRIGVSAYGRAGENDVQKPLSPQRNPRENARSSTTVEQR
jgi:hypothetical protein